ncbi:MAG: ParA family protein [Endomicrobiales bacterium]
MSKIIAVANQKGGVGKTTTAINLAASLAFLGQETLLIDMDPQGNTTSGLGIDRKTIVEKNIYRVLVDEMLLEDVLRTTELDWLDLAPAYVDLIGAEVELVNLPRRELRLKEALAQFHKVYKYIIIDCPPSLGLLTLNSLVAAHSVVIPIQCEYYALEGLGQLLKTIDLIRQSFNPSLELEGVLLTMYDSRINLSRQVIEEVKKFFGDKVYATRVPRTVRLAEAPGFGKPVILYDKTSRGAKAYLDMAREFLSRQPHAPQPARKEPEKKDLPQEGTAGQ